MRLYVANCLIISAISLTIVLTITRRFFSIANTYEASFYSIYVFLTAENILFLFSSCIEISLVVERVSYLFPSRSRLTKFTSFNRFFFILFIVCILINIPGIFLFDPAFVDVQLDANTKFRIWYFDVAPLSYSLTGKIFTYFGYIFRDILPMTLKMIINFLSIHLVRKYVKKKQRIKSTSSSATSSSQMANFDRKETYIALVMSTFSLIEHLLYISNYVLYFLYYYDLSNLVYIFAVLFIATKHLLIFFILLLFNNLFRNEVKKFLKITA